MKVEQLASGTYRVRIMIDGQGYTFTDKALNHFESVTKFVTK